MDFAALVETLTVVLEAETEALVVGDYAAAGRMARDKVAAVEAFVAASGQDPPDATTEVLDRLRRAAEANRKALEQAVAVQRNLVMLVARTVQASSGPPQGYGRPDPLDAAPLAVSIKA